MKYSQSFIKTSKETPSNESAKNAQLLIRAGFIKKEMAGVYSFLPMGLRVLRKISDIVREEMDKVGAQEILMPALSPKENWEKTKRWDTVDVLYKMELSENKEIALSPTHEELVTPLVQQFCRSHKDFPVCVYQIQSKFRKEPRAKSGLLRGREFLMKDAYSFHTSQEDFETYYEIQRKAYERIYNRLGVGDITLYVVASGGDFSKFSHEFQTLSEIGEDEIFIDLVTKEAFNKEIAQGIPDKKNTDDSTEELQTVEAPRNNSIAGSVKLFNIDAWQVLKTVVFATESNQLIGACIRGDLEVNELLLQDLVGEKIYPATENQLKENNLVQGFISPVNKPDCLKKIYGDESLKTAKNFNTGANEFQKDYLNANLERDFTIDIWGSFAVPTAQFKSMKNNPLEIKKAVEVGNIFPLATKFSDAFNFKVTDENGKEVSVIMGCYGFGVSRIMGVLAELFADEKGLVWPKSVAPFQVYLAAIGKNDEVYTKAEALYQELLSSGVEVFYDDRRGKKIGPGQKFKDHELFGIPTRVLISERSLEDSLVEVVDRKSGEMQKIKIEEVLDFLSKNS